MADELYWFSKNMSSELIAKDADYKPLWLKRWRECSKVSEGKQREPSYLGQKPFLERDEGSNW